MNSFTIFINSIREIMTSSTATIYAIFGMFIFSEIMVFSTFIWGYLHTRLSNPVLSSEIAIETYAQISDALNIGSVLVSLTLQRMQENSDHEIDFFIEQLFSVGVTFLSFQNDEYTLLSFYINDCWVALYFYILTGLHSLHVCVGCSLIIIHSFMFSGDGSIRDDDFNAGVYWHFVEMIWIVLTSLLFLL